VALLPAPPADPGPTQSAVIVAVPSAEPVVEKHRLRFDEAASWGVPAHVTVLYPFLHPTRLDAGVIELVRKALSAVAAFACSFSSTRWFGADVVWLAPEPSTPFAEMTAALVGAFPDCSPYGGAYGDDVTPHLTLGEARLGSADELRAAELEVAAVLPVEATVTEALLIAGTTAPGSWGIVSRLPLRG
jgi:2'-5' RNA ligase